MAAGEPVTDTQLVRIAHGLVAETSQYLEDSRVWRGIEGSSWTAFQDHFTGAREDFCKHQQTARQGVYGSNNMVGIENSFSTLNSQQQRTGRQL